MADPPSPPTTRFQGSKHKLLAWLWSHLSKLEFETCLDAFGGSGCVSHFLKGKGKRVAFNDTMAWCVRGAQAILVNQDVRLDLAAAGALTHRAPAIAYDDVIARTFDGIYFTGEENVWLDVVAQNIARMPDRDERAIAWHALFQSAIAKRPYNLFHRRNLYMRLARVPRTFGNKSTWDKPFEQTFTGFVERANDAVFSGPPCAALHQEAAMVEGEFDLVYLDPPYMNSRGVGVDYPGFYHFLDGMLDYTRWSEKIDMRSPHRRLASSPSPWTSRRSIHDAFKKVLDKHRRSMLAVSYRSDGIPSLEEIAGMLQGYKRRVSVHLLPERYTYALSTNRGSREALLIGTD